MKPPLIKTGEEQKAEFEKRKKTKAEAAEKLKSDNLNRSVATVERQPTPVSIATKTQEWFILKRDGKHGPFTDNDLRQFARVGKINGDTIVQTGNLDPFPAQKLKGIYPDPVEQPPDEPPNAAGTNNVPFFSLADADQPRVSREFSAFLALALSVIPGLAHLTQGRVVSAFVFGMSIPAAIYAGDSLLFWMIEFPWLMLAAWDIVQYVLTGHSPFSGLDGIIPNSNPETRYSRAFAFIVMTPLIALATLVAVMFAAFVLGGPVNPHGN